MTDRQSDAFDLLMNAMLHGTDKAVDIQERRGQKKAVANDTLPREGMHEVGPLLEKYGGSVGDLADDLFVHVTLPNGWTKRATDHSMWNEVLDDQGRARISFFYKAAFYDRKAHCRLLRRFTIDRYAGDNDKVVTVSVADAKGEVEIAAEVELHPNDDDYNVRDDLAKEVQASLEEQFPNWQDPMEYWD